MPASEITLAELLKGAGYHTVHIGKWHLGGTHGMAPHEQGFDESLSMASGLYLPVDDPDVVNSKQDFDPIDRFLWRALRHAASFNGSPAFAPARLRHGLLHGRGREGDRRERATGRSSCTWRTGRRTRRSRRRARTTTRSRRSPITACASTPR